MAKKIIRFVYLYIFSTVGLVLIVMGAVRLSDLGLRTLVFKKADSYIRWPEYSMRPLSAPAEFEKGQESKEPTPEEKAKFEKKQTETQKEQQAMERERVAASSLAMIMVGIPLFLYHWQVIQKEREG